MSELDFEVTDRKQITIADVIYAEIKDLGWEMKLYLDTDTGDILYPVKIENGKFGMNIMLDSKDRASCVFPLSIPESEVDSIKDALGTVHEAIGASRKLINEQGD